MRDDIIVLPKDAGEPVSSKQKNTMLGPCSSEAVGQFFRYFSVSLAALVLDVGLFSLCFRFFSMPWWWAAALGFTAGAALAYVGSIAWVFRERRLLRSRSLEFLGFVAIGLLGLAVTQTILFLGIEVFGLMPEYVRLAASVATFLFNYALRAVLLFSKSRFLS